MDTYRFVLAVEVEVEAFDETDARELINDHFAPGEDCGIEIKGLAVKEVK
jgi:hypothetical protein